MSDASDALKASFGLIGTLAITGAAIDLYRDSFKQAYRKPKKSSLKDPFGVSLRI